MGLVSFFLTLAVIVLWRRSRSFERRLRKIENEFRLDVKRSNLDRREIRGRTIEKRSAARAKSQLDADQAAGISRRPTVGTESLEQEVVSPTTETEETEKTLTKAKPAGDPALIADLANQLQGKKGKPKQTSERRHKLEKQLFANWIPIVGAMAVVSGFTFLSGYAGLKLPPIYRSLMLAGLSVLVSGGGWFLIRLERWKQLGLWIRSIGGALFLFACFGSSAVSGLRWIQSMEIALLVLVAGLAVNMALAYVVGVQGFASLHVVLSLIPLALVPQSVTSIVLATAVTGTGLALSLKKSWDVHVAITLAAYLVFHLVWYAGVEVPKPDVVGLASALVISAAIVGVHLLERDQAVRLRAARLLTHLAAWTAGGIGSILYIEEPWIRSAALAALSIAAFSVSRKAKASSVRWMHLGDVLTAQALAIAAVVSLHTLMFHWMLVPAILLAQAWLFLLVVNNENEEMLVRVGMHLVHAFILLMFAGTVFILPVEDPDLKNQLTVLLFASAGLTTLLHADVARKRGHEFDSSSMYGLHSHKTNWSHSWSAVGSGLLACAGIFLQYEGRWLAWSALGATSFMLFVARRAKSPSLGLGALVTVLAGCVLTWIPLLDYHPVEIGRQLGYHFPPLFLAALFTIIWAPTGTTHRFVTNAGSYLLGVHLGISAFTLLQPISPYIPAVMWLCLAVIALEVANRVPLHLIRPAVHAGLGYMTAFAGAYALVILQSDIQIGIVSLREIIEAFALAVAVYWWTYRPKTDLAEDKTWRLINPLFLELGLVFLAIVVTVETPTHWRPAAWVALAWVAAASRAPTKLDTRFTFYSILFYWLSAADLVIVTSSYVFPTGSWINKPGFTGGIAIALQIFYLALGTKHLDLSRVSFPRALSAFERLTQAMAARRHLWIYYPFFVSTALFLYWRFDATLLTLLWSVEAFIVFALSIVLKESHFRYMAIGALVACLVRLVVFDLSQANLGLRGLVFVGVGLMMLAMNALYNKYKERLS